MATRLLPAMVGTVLTHSALGAAVASADGLPILGLESNRSGVSTPAGEVRFQTRPAQGETRVLRVSRDGHVLRSERLRGRFMIPVVAYDGSPAGPSADGQTLVLVGPRVRFPQSATSLTILHARTLGVRFHLHLRGDFSFDAISPNGRWIYLIQYTSGLDATRYRVRALDVDTGQLLRADVVDPHDRADAMRGSPITRATSLDGRWAYTLYDGLGQPFVHALDTTRRQARCLDVPVFPSSSDPWTARLRFTPERTQLLVTIDHYIVASIDTRTLTVDKRSAHSPRARPSTDRTASETVYVAVPIAAIVAILGAGMLIVRRRPQRLLKSLDAR